MGSHDELPRGGAEEGASRRHLLAERVSAFADELHSIVRELLDPLSANRTVSPAALTEGLLDRMIAREPIDADDRLYVRACFARLCRNSLLAVARQMESTTRGLRTLANLVSTSIQLDLPRGTPLATIEELLRRLQSMHPRMAQLTELRLFGEFTLEECAAELGISASTARREWVYAKSFVSQQAAQFQGSSARLLPHDPARNLRPDPYTDGHQP